MQTSRPWGGANLWAKFQILTVFGAIFSHFCPHKMWNLTPMPNFTFIEPMCPPAGRNHWVNTTSCAARWPPQYAPAPWPWLLTFWPWSRCGSRMSPDVPCAKFRLPRPFGFRVRADVRDIRQTDGQTDGHTDGRTDRRTDDGRRSPHNAP